MTVLDAGHLSRPVALGLLLIMGVMWGLQFAMLKLAAGGGHSEYAVLTVALMLLSIIFAAILAIRRELYALNRERVIFLLVTALLGYIVPLSVSLYAVPHISAGLLTLIVSLTPVIAVLVALITRAEGVSTARILAVMLGLVAVGLVLWPELSLADFGVSGWIALALIVPLSYGIEAIYIAANWPRGLTALQAAGGETLLATALMIPFLLIVEGVPPLPTAWTNAELGILVFVMSGVVEVLLFFYLIQKAGGVFTALGSFITLFAGIGWGMLLFDENHSGLVWLAVAILVVALTLSIFDKPVRKAAADAADPSGH